ncbi:hypothetical protein [Actinomadura sp. KC06]|nr:hypothetical protein [Actinomadura sp. KC06]
MTLALLLGSLAGMVVAVMRSRAASWRWFGMDGVREPGCYATSTVSGS